MKVPHSNSLRDSLADTESGHLPLDYIKSKKTKSTQTLLSLKSVWKHLTTKMSFLTSDSDSENNKESAPAPFQIKKLDVLCSKSVRYLVLDFNGEGCFGKVAKCLNLKTSEITAIKIHKMSENHMIKKEVEMLTKIRALDPEKKNLVRFIDNFMFQDASCLAFEMLDRSLWDLLNQRQTTLSLHEIRPITQQLLVAFEALKIIGIIHTDLKPDNVMLVNHHEEPFRVKLIDFGLALPASKVKVGMTVQPCAYRAPEVTLGLPISEAIDMWALGCVMAFLYFGDNLFPGQSTYHMMKAVCRLLGQPKDHVLSTGRNTWQYFSREQGSPNPRWRLNTPREYTKATGVQPRNPRWIFNDGRNLDKSVECYAEVDDYTEYEDRMAFLHFLKGLLDTDAQTRFTPERAQRHCFVTMFHLHHEDMGTNSYAEDALELMTVSPRDDSEESHDFPSNSETERESTVSSDGVTSTYSSSHEDTDPAAYHYIRQCAALRAHLHRQPSWTSSAEDSYSVSSSYEEQEPQEHSMEPDTSYLSEGEYIPISGDANFSDGEYIPVIDDEDGSDNETVAVNIKHFHCNGTTSTHFDGPPPQTGIKTESHTAIQKDSLPESSSDGYLHTDISSDEDADADRDWDEAFFTPETFDRSAVT
ncbi:homeodomain-interacting protein kinase 2-like [Sander lucioperca]|uniref:homeodomain-interacting protein kinase 2-like n=1 Tax=Sander lucioperca TaxID=283035 RepID=UPI00125D9C77|nr:homeodomain-interacting protein kinase 2-like [Sander lucioperca]